MAYIALKPCRFAGLDFRIEDPVPEDVVQPGAAKNLVKMGILGTSGTRAAPAVTTHTESEGVTIAIHVEEGDLLLNVSTDALQSVFDVLTSRAPEAETVIQGMTETNALILVDVADSRKAVRAAAQERAQALNGEGADSEEGEE